MPRTPMMGFIRALARAHAGAQSIGASPDEWRARAAVAAPSRRAVLAGGATALAASFALPRKARAAGAPPRIAIVGAGIAGLVAALTLRDDGLASTLYEAAERIGGRMHSESGDIAPQWYWSDRQSSEYGGELIDSGHTTIRGLAKRYGLALNDRKAAAPPGATQTYAFPDPNAPSRYYSEAEADADFAPVYAALQIDVNAAGYPTLWNRATDAGRALDAMSVYDWIQSRVPGGVGSRMGRLLNVAYEIEYGAPTTDQSALNIVYLLGFQNDPKRFNLFGQSDERYHIDGGNQRLPEAIAADIATDAPINRGWRLTRIAQGAAGVTLDFAVGERRETVICDQAILALPFAVLRRLDFADANFNERKVKAIAELGRSRNAKLMTQYSDRFWQSPGPWGVSEGTFYTDAGYAYHERGYTARGPQNGWDTSLGQSGMAGLVTNYTGGAAATAFTPSTPYSKIDDNPEVGAYAHQFLERFEPVFPSAERRWNGKAILSTPFRDPNLRLAYSYWRVGQYTTIAGYERARQGAIHFAGEHCSINFQGFMEGAAEEGRRAAHEVARA